MSLKTRIATGRGDSCAPSYDTMGAMADDERSIRPNYRSRGRCMSLCGLCYVAIKSSTRIVSAMAHGNF